MLVTNSFPSGVPMPLGGVAPLAALLLVALQPDTLYSRPQVLRRLRQANCANPEIHLEAALEAGWLHIEVNGDIGYASRSWCLMSKIVAVPATIIKPAYFSYFEGPITNTKPCRDILVLDLWKLIASSQLAEITQQLRSLPIGSEARKRLKNQLPYVTPAGTFILRANNNLVASSGLMVLDFDHVDDVTGTRARLLSDPKLPVEMLFTSPSGDGIKALVRVPLKHTHRVNFAALTAYLQQQHSVAPDPNGKDVARACFVCYDPEAWINPIHLPENLV